MQTMDRLSLGSQPSPQFVKATRQLNIFLRVRVTWVNLLMYVMGGSAINASGITDGAVWSYIWVKDKVIDTLEGWCL